jgi:hypothetical protein
MKTIEKQIEEIRVIDYLINAKAKFLRMGRDPNSFIRYKDEIYHLNRIKETYFHMKKLKEDF